MKFRTEKEYLQETIGPLKGGRIMDAKVETTGDFEYGHLDVMILVIQMPDGKIKQLEILGDAEGNSALLTLKYLIQQRTIHNGYKNRLCRTNWP